VTRRDTEVRNEARGSGLWGTGRGGGGSRDSRNNALRRGLLALLALTLAAPLAASAGRGHRSWARSYLAPSLARVAAQTPNATVPVIVQSTEGSGEAADALESFTSTTRRLSIVGAAAAAVSAGDLPELAREHDLVITPDQAVVFDGKPEATKGHKPRNRGPHGGPYSSSDVWPAAVGADQLWPSIAGNGRNAPAAPTIAFVDSGIDVSRPDFGARVLAQVDFTTLPGNSTGDGRGHGTFVAGLAAGSAASHAGAAPTSGIVALDVMDDQGTARTSDVIAAAQWIVRNHNAYNIRVANFSLHSASPTSFRWDPLDKAIEKVWFSGVVVVAPAGNQGQGANPTPMAYAPGNDPFVITVGALDVHSSAKPERAEMAPWSAWGYTLDGFSKPELSAPGRAIVGPVPVDSTLAAERPGQLVRTREGTYMTLSGTSLSAPIVAGLAADLLTFHPYWTPDQVKGALMHGARALPKVRTLAAGVGEAYGPTAAQSWSPPNPNRALDAFLIRDPDAGGVIFDDVSWLAGAKVSTAWDTVSWLDGWADVSWSDVSWSDVSWSDVSWSDVSWSDVSWSDVSSTDVSWADVARRVYGDVAP